MKKLILLLTLISALFLTTACVKEDQETVAPNQEQANSENREDAEELNDTKHQEESEVTQEGTEGSKGFLWKTKKGNTTVYLLGSVHIAKEDMYPLRGEIIEAFEESDRLVVEADISNLNVQEIQAFMEANGQYIDGATLKDNISEEVYAKLDEVLQKYNRSAEEFNQYKPWNFYMMLPRILYVELEYDQTPGIDDYFLFNATNEMEIIELEGAMFQLNLFNDLTENVQEYLLSSTIDYMDELEKDLEQSMSIWKTGDLKGLEKLINDSYHGSKENKEFQKILLDDRNIGMVEQIEEYLNSQDGKTYFVVAGAAHYVGDMGIINLLQNKGYEVSTE